MLHTVKPLNNHHPWNPIFVSLVDRWLVFKSKFMIFKLKMRKLKWDPKLAVAIQWSLVRFHYNLRSFLKLIFWQITFLMIDDWAHNWNALKLIKSDKKFSTNYLHFVVEQKLRWDLNMSVFFAKVNFKNQFVTRKKGKSPTAPSKVKWLLSEVKLRVDKRGFGMRFLHCGAFMISFYMLVGWSTSASSSTMGL